MSDGNVYCQQVSARVIVWLAISYGMHNKMGSNLTSLPILTLYKNIYIKSKYYYYGHDLACGHILLQQIDGNQLRIIRTKQLSTQKVSVMVAHTYKRCRELLGVALCNTQPEDGVETLTKTHSHGLDRCRRVLRVYCNVIASLVRDLQTPMTQCLRTF